ncbi:hypothetical protein LU699_16765 [Luteimonas fraxinea]|uniref:DUF3592 domain-containing protein n=1 Tax=Luteimonas fraxinea TaxID=2901869 RepID=A0ABS8UCH0_9GAMM|nr:hypothetical protein [Luteimonas fraxinea]MCD9096764.1 hypothetical protein [Luteimonas fraxinea]MCD9126133.1 hypothetical protein [Luteimonas fraxinea]UHH09887.1 hypothetical protein LU699_16765 [Luteimonas fraxinea]
MTTASARWSVVRFARRLAANLVYFVIPGAALLLIVVCTLSPRAFSMMQVVFDKPDRVVALVESCELVRDGVNRQHAVRCAVQYDAQGDSHRIALDVWSTASPFATPASLHRELAWQRARPTREILVSPGFPLDATVIDTRWLAVPGLWVFLLTGAGVLVGCAVYSLPRDKVHRRRDYVRDPGTDRLMPINAIRHRRGSVRRFVLWSAALLAAALLCVYGVSSRMRTELSMLGFSDLVAHPAQLADCAHVRVGAVKGHRQIECHVRYQAGGVVFTGQAESLDFRFFPTGARLDARVAGLDGTPVVAWIDPVHPAYALALIDRRWIVPHTLGVFELMLLALLVGLLWMALMLVRRQGMFRNLGPD